MLDDKQTILTAIIDAIPDYVYAKDANGRFTVANQGVTVLMGAKSPADVIGHTVMDFFPEDLAKQYHADDMTIIKTGQALINREERTVDHTGKTGWALTTKVPIRDAQGGVIGLVGISRDISDLKQTQQMLEQTRADLENRVIERTANLQRSQEFMRATLDTLIENAQHGADSREMLTTLKQAESQFKWIDSS